MTEAMAVYADGLAGRLGEGRGMQELFTAARRALCEEAVRCTATILQVRVVRVGLKGVSAADEAFSVVYAFLFTVAAAVAVVTRGP
jgi:hypothetical protein